MFNKKLCDSITIFFSCFYYAGIFSSICSGKFDLGSYCTQRIIIDVINVLFLVVLWLSLVVVSLWKHHISSANRSNWTFIVVSICCGLTSLAYIVAGFGNLITKRYIFDHSSWLICLVRALVWISFSVSLHLQRSQWIRVLNCVWWVASFSLISAVNIEKLIGTKSIEFIDIVLWIVNLLLLVCAFKNIRQMVSQHKEDESSSEPLVFKGAKQTKTELGQVGFLKKLAFSWIGPLLSLGYSKPLSLEEIPSLGSEDEANIGYQKFKQAWDSLLREKGPDNTMNFVLWSIVKVYVKENIFIGICALLRTISVVVSPLILYAFVKYANNNEENLQQGLSILGCLVLSKLVESLSQRHWFFYSRRCGMRMRSALMVAVYEKQLKLSSLGRKRHSTGEIVNYVAVDAYRMGECPWWFHLAWTCGVQLFLSIVVLFKVTGYGALPGLLPLLICGLLNVPFAKLLQKCQYELMVAQDERLRSTSEILNSMKIIKLQAWEQKFKNLIESRRDRELKWLAEAQFKKVYGTLLYWMSPTIVSSVVFLGCVFLRSAPLNASTIFTVLATLRSMGEPVRMIPEALSVMIQVKVSFDRLNSFLLDDELKDVAQRRYIVPNSKKSLEIQEGIFSWDPESTIPTLQDVNLEIGLGQKIAVCGPVGGGKSSLLYAILGEIPKLSGTVSKEQECTTYYFFLEPFILFLYNSCLLMLAHRLKYLDPLPMFHKLLGYKVGQFVITYYMGSQWKRINIKRL